jgi:hypothetical protein
MIQTLSNMAIQEAGVDIPQVANQSLCEEVAQTLRNLPLLNEDESRWDAEMVIVKASNRLGRYLIEAEDLSRYMTTNGIDNAKEAVCNILEANGLEGQFLNVAIVIDEASILEDMEELGYAVSGAMKTPPKGLGLAMIGKQEDFKKLRRIANTKQLMDVLTGRYGLPLIRKNYNKVGFLEAFALDEAAKAEDTELKVGKDDQVIHENPKDDKSKGKKKDEESSDVDDVIKEDKPKGGKGSKGKKEDDDDGSDNEAEKTEQPGDEDQMQEAAYEQMTAHELQIQRLKDIMAGKMDDEFF